MHCNHAARADRLPYVYIAGAGYSGSTLLAFLLNAHPQMVSTSEVEGPTPDVNLQEYRCSCGALLLRCPFFLTLERRIKVLGSEFALTNWQTSFQLSEYRLLDIVFARTLRSSLLDQCRDVLVPFVPGYTRTVATISRRMVHFAQAVLAISGKHVFVDAQKDSERIKFLSHIEEFDLKVIHLVRDVRGAVASRMKHAARNDPAWATRKWCTANLNVERAKRYVASDHWLRVTYSDLCATTQGTLDRIADFVGVQRVPVCENVYDGEHHIIGNQMRLKNAAPIQEDQSWKRLLSDRDLAVIARIGGAINRYFGHPWP
ncbi:MAG: sulfotransferase [Candidatus Binatia bacterium]